MKTAFFSGDDFSSAVALLKSGKPLIFPTETVYGLGGSLFHEEAIHSIFKLKGRPSDNPLIAHAASVAMAAQLGQDLPPSFYRLAEAFWPGPLTLVVKRNPRVPSMVSAGHPTLAIRIPSHPIALQLISAFSAPLAAPSANLSGKPSPTTLKDALEDFEGKVELAIDGGPCSIGIESTVLSLYHSTPTLLRPGHITPPMLEEVLQSKIAFASSHEPTLSPGMKYRHYAPKARLKLVSQESDLRASFILSPVPLKEKKYRLLNAQTFYASLREADRLGLDEIEIYCHPILETNAGLMNRLLRAAGQL